MLEGNGMICTLVKRTYSYIWTRTGIGRESKVAGGAGIMVEDGIVMEKDGGVFV